MSQPYFNDVFLDLHTCPSAVKLDINMLRVVCQVLAYRQEADIPRTLDVLKRFIASEIDPVIEANGGVPSWFISQGCSEREPSISFASNHQVIIFNTLVSLDSEKETAVLMTKFAKCNPPLLVNNSTGYPESLLHIALSSHEMQTSPLLQWWGQVDQHARSKWTSSTSS